MAAPTSKTLKDLNGKWNLNKELSDSPDAGLALQGIGYLTRKGIGLASISITVKQYEGPAKQPAGPAGDGPFTHIDIVQSASGLTSTQELRCLDDHAREHSDWLFGTVDGRSRWARLADIEGAYLKQGWLTTGDGNDDTVVVNRAVSKGNGWTATQVWGFQEIKSQRRYCRNVVIEKGDKSAEFRLVYDFVE
ncbi:LCCL domain-containing protein [Hirsutella rhossiliensis]|uniref:LCCL domain-containing protein n=1 Tax=Hirsutella rhossiliensis TaxID=111463 RepID=A0A9P8MJA4_9HYPO|nr:LCCL domain-containing protein [Hirsutella rhossiliensis]KAH0957388.1 LCCL domain-containing protein [Hirsutella rhossiliensis]